METRTSTVREQGECSPMLHPHSMPQSSLASDAAAPDAPATSLSPDDAANTLAVALALTELASAASPSAASAGHAASALRLLSRRS